MPNNFDKSFDELIKLEFNNQYDALHKNDGEIGYTFMGIYEGAHPNWQGWNFIYKYKNSHETIEEASAEAYKDTYLHKLVKEFYKTEFWDKMNLNKLNNARTADLIFKFAVNTGIKRAVKYAQTIADVRTDGLIGEKTAKALNSLDATIFEKKYKDIFKKFYDYLVEKNPKYKKFSFGWQKRVKLSQTDIDFINFS